MIGRRSFLIGIGAAFAAPAVVRAESLMQLWVPPAPDILCPSADLRGADWKAVVYTLPRDWNVQAFRYLDEYLDQKGAYV